MATTKKDMENFLAWLGTTSDDFEEEVAKQAARESFAECYRVDLPAEVGRTL